MMKFPVRLTLSISCLLLAAEAALGGSCGTRPVAQKKKAAKAVFMSTAIENTREMISVRRYAGAGVAVERSWKKAEVKEVPDVRPPDGMIGRMRTMKPLWQTWIDILLAKNKSSRHSQSPPRPHQAALGEPYPNEEWAVWYADTFDRDSPPRVDVKGRGLVEGLVQLWARHLFETVRPDGQRGFSSFDLRWKQGRIEIDGDREGAQRLRGWMFGKKESSYKGYAAEADPVLLKKVALAHARLIERRQKAEQVLAIALAAKDKTDFANRLDDLIKK